MKNPLRSGAGFVLVFVRAVAPAFVCAVALGAASGTTPLDQYFDGLTTLRASFTQTVKDAHGKEVDHTTGTLVVSRPGKFRWEVHPKAASGGAGQLLVADGRNVWFFDRDLEQVTVKPVDTALSSTPAMLLSGASDLRENFKLTPAGARDGLDWVLVEPKRTQADFRRALFGFTKGNLQRMIIDDRLGQTATIEFDSVKRNEPVAPDEVSFVPPKGTDVIGTPAS
ncbi:MAG TPA: outer membrane lipoprotein chaperone LolA [Steroidobacteraceae bacterium]|jgi:outer membrane lipoprotein carrier protein|nr:outer membrane lipoprotein chaperone LolA [Steroidobacteraceae bacterium]